MVSIFKRRKRQIVSILILSIFKFEVNGEENEPFNDFVSGIVEAGIEDQEPPPLVRNLEFEPGTLSIFHGNQCLHRVTKCSGDIDRLVAILCFSPKEGTRNSAKVQEMFWGRTK